jgi:hypothetical protein
MSVLTEEMERMAEAARLREGVTRMTVMALATMSPVVVTGNSRLCAETETGEGGILYGGHLILRERMEKDTAFDVIDSL